MSSDGDGLGNLPPSTEPGLPHDAEEPATGERSAQPSGAELSAPSAGPSGEAQPHVPPIAAQRVADEPRVAADERRPGRDLIRLLSEPAVGARFAAFRPSHAAIAAMVALVLGAGFVAGAQALATKPKGPMLEAQAGPPPETTDALLHHVQDEVRSLKSALDAIRASTASTKGEDAIRGLKRSVDTLKGDLETVKAASSGVAAQLGAKIDKLDRDPNPKLAEISARLDRIDKEPNPKLAEIASRLDHIDHDPTSKLAEITSRLDRIEKQVSSPTPTASIAPSSRPARLAVSAPAVPLSEPKAAPKPVTVAGWELRDVYGGVALLEGRAGGLREVAPGEFVPGVGEIRSIERRGKSWVVVTSRGLIEAANRW